MQIHLMFEQLSQSFASCLSSHGRHSNFPGLIIETETETFGSRDIETEAETFMLGLMKLRPRPRLLNGVS